MEQVIRRAVVGHVEIDAVVVIQVGGDDAQAPSVGLDAARGRGHIDEPAAVVPEDMVRRRLDLAGGTVEVVPLLVEAQRRIRRVPDHVVADVQVEVAVIVQVRESRRAGIVARAGQPGAFRRVFESAVAPVAIERVRPKPGDEQVGAAVVVVIAGRDAQPVALSPGERGDPRGFGDILESPVAAVVEKTVARNRGGLVPVAGLLQDRPALHAVDVEPAVAVEVEQSHAARRRLGHQVLRGPAVVEGEDQTRSLGVVDEPDGRTARRLDGRAIVPRGS